MNYIKLDTFNYTETDDEIIFGQDQTGVFCYQIMTNKYFNPEKTLTDNINDIRESVQEIVDEEHYTLTHKDITSMTIDSVEILLETQQMDFTNKSTAVQQNAYFIDPNTNTLSIIQFGTVPISEEDWDKYGEGLSSYTYATIRRILNNMFLPETLRLPIKSFIFEVETD